MNYIIIKISESDYSHFATKFNDYNIYFSVYKIKEKNYLLRVLEKDYKLIKKIDYREKILFYRRCGSKYIFDLIRHNIEKLIITISIIFVVILSSHIILRVKINTSDKKLESLIKYALEDENIYPLKMKKNYQDLLEIKKRIKKRFEDQIEWLEIEENGSKYNIYLIKKVKNKTKENHDKCNYVAKKSGLITSIYAEKGVLLVSENNYIRKKDILISGQIIYNDEIKKEVCARGRIFGEVWYKVEVYIPVEKSQKIYKKTNKYNLQINFFGKTYKIFKNKYDEENKVTNIGSKKLGLSILREYKIKTNKKAYTSGELEKIGINKARESLLVKLPKNAKIIDEKVLKKNMINGKMYIEVLITTNEELGVVENY